MTDSSVVFNGLQDQACSPGFSRNLDGGSGDRALGGAGLVRPRPRGPARSPRQAFGARKEPQGARRRVGALPPPSPAQARKPLLIPAQALGLPRSQRPQRS